MSNKKFKRFIALVDGNEREIFSLQEKNGELHIFRRRIFAEIDGYKNVKEYMNKITIHKGKNENANGTVITYTRGIGSGGFLRNVSFINHLDGKLVWPVFLYRHPDPSHHVYEFDRNSIDEYIQIAKLNSNYNNLVLEMVVTRNCDIGELNNFVKFEFSIFTLYVGVKFIHFPCIGKGDEVIVTTSSAMHDDMIHVNRPRMEKYSMNISDLIFSIVELENALMIKLRQRLKDSSDGVLERTGEFNYELNSLSIKLYPLATV